MNPTEEQNNGTSSELKRPYSEIAPATAVLDSDDDASQNKKLRTVADDGSLNEFCKDIIASDDDDDESPSIITRRVSDYGSSPPSRLHSQGNGGSSAINTQQFTTAINEQEMPYSTIPATSVTNLETNPQYVEPSSSSDEQQEETNSSTDDSSEDELDEESEKLHAAITETPVEHTFYPVTAASSTTKRKSSLSARRQYIKGRNSRKSNLLVACGMLAFLLIFGRHSSMNHGPINPVSVFVSGGGFSGFWFSIGRLQSIEDKDSKDYYCYSAGCLAVVAALGNCTITQMSDISFGVQNRWKEGETKHHNVVRDFLNNFLATPNIDRLLQNEELLSKINVITTVRDGWFGIKSSVRSPTTYANLYEMLLQTTWIPFATGERLWNTDVNGEDHMDGIFSTQDHPVCAHNIGLPSNWDIRVNALNVNLGLDKVEKFWNEGLEYGL